MKLLHCLHQVTSLWASLFPRCLGQGSIPRYVTKFQPNRSPDFYSSGTPEALVSVVWWSAYGNSIARWWRIQLQDHTAWVQTPVLPLWSWASYCPNVEDDIEFTVFVLGPHELTHVRLLKPSPAHSTWQVYVVTPCLCIPLLLHLPSTGGSPAPSLGPTLALQRRR